MSTRVRRRPRLSRCLAFLTLLAFASGCYKWVTPTEPLEQAVASGDETVRVWTTEGEVITLTAARVEGALLIGKRGERPDTIPFASIQRFEIEKHNTAGDLIIIGSIAAVVTLVIIALANVGGFPPSSP